MTQYLYAWWSMEYGCLVSYGGTWTVTIKTTYDPIQNPIPICLMEYGWWMFAFIWRYMVSHHKNNIWPKPRPNTNMCEWVWMMEVCWHMKVHGHWSYTIKITYDPSQNPIPLCVIEYGWWMYAFIWWYMGSHHKNNIWPKPRPNTNMWMMDVCCHMKVHGHIP